MTSCQRIHKQLSESGSWGDFFGCLPLLRIPLISLVHIHNYFTMSEKLCLQWNNFQDNVRSTFGNLRESNDFADVTLACEDGHQIEVHKVVLAASSPFFQAILKRNKHSHPHERDEVG